MVQDIRTYQQRSAGDKACAFLLGMLCAAAQVFVFREMMAALYGNELIFTAIMAAWSAGVGTGGIAGRRLRHSKRLLAGGVIVLVLTIEACRHVRGWLGWPLGEAGALWPSLLVAGALTFPLGVVLGTCFAALVGDKDERQGVLFYAIETLGFAAGALVMIVFLFSPFSRVSAAVRAPQWPGYQVVATRETPQASLVIAARQGEVSLFENGVHTATSHDALTAEESVHYALLAHPAPRRLLLIGGAASGAVSEALKYPGLRIDLLEPDAGVLELIRPFFREAAAALKDARVTVMTGDGRRALRFSREPYDVVIVLAGEPRSLLADRFYTADFFRDVRRHLAPGGILSLILSASENYVNDEGRKALGGVRATLASVFGEIGVIPGGRYIFLAAPKPGSFTLDPATLGARLTARGIATVFVRPEFFNDRLGRDRRQEAAAVTAGGGDINTDIRPSGLLDALSYWSSATGPSFSGTVSAFRQYGGLLWGLPVVVFLLVRRKNAAVLPLVAGFGQMLFQAAAIILFQSVFGNIYTLIGLITSGMMLGLFAGASGFFRKRAASPFLSGAVVFAAAAAAVPWIIGQDLAAGVFFLVVPFLAGAWGGHQFAAAAAVNRTVFAYGLDVLGSGIGALLGGLFLIPLWGIPQALLFAAALQAAVSLGLARNGVSAGEIVG